MVEAILTSGAIAVAVAALVVAALWIGHRSRAPETGGTVSLDTLLDGDDEAGYEARHRVDNDETVLIPAVADPSGAFR